MRVVVEEPSDLELADRPSISLGNLSVFTKNYGVFVDDNFVELTAQEFDILRIMLEHPDEVLPYTMLTQKLWRASGERQLRSLHVLVFRLRQKLSGSNPFSIETVRRRGYGLIKARASPPVAHGLQEAKPVRV